jgi:hypothetical protein
MLDYIILMIIVGVAALASSIYYMQKGGYDIYDKHKGAH